MSVSTTVAALKRRRGQPLGNRPVFDFSPHASSPAFLATSIALNGNTLDARAFYIGDGVDSMTARVGDTPTSAGSGAEPANSLAHIFNTDCAIRFGGAGLKSASGASPGSSRAVISELVLNVRDITATQYVYGNFKTGEASWQWFITGGRIYFQLSDGIATARTSNAAITLGINHCFVVMDTTSATQAMHVDAVPDTATSGTYPASVTTIVEPHMGLRENDTSKYTGEICSAAIWYENVDPGLAAEWETLARTRCYGLLGFSSRGVPASSCSRLSEKCVEFVGSDNVSRYVQLGANLPSVGKRSRETVYSYYRAEGAGTSTVEYPTDCSQASDWSYMRITSTAKSTKKGPVNGLTVNEIVSDALNNTHYVSFDGGAGSSNHVWSTIVGAGDKEYVSLISTGAGASSVKFHLSGDGSVVSQGGDATKVGIRFLGTIDGIRYYYLFMYYATGAVSAHSHRLQPGLELTDIYTGDGVTVDLYFAFAQHEIQVAGCPTSPMINDDTGSSRALESNEFAFPDGADTGRYVHSIRTDDLHQSPGTLRWLSSINDSNDTNNRIGTYLDDSGAIDELKVISVKAGSSTALNAGTFTDGQTDLVNMEYEDGGDLSVETESGLSDSAGSASVPTPDTVRIANAFNGGFQGTYIDTITLKVYK